MDVERPSVAVAPSPPMAWASDAFTELLRRRRVTQRGPLAAQLREALEAAVLDVHVLAGEHPGAATPKS